MMMPPGRESRDGGRRSPYRCDRLTPPGRGGGAAVIRSTTCPLTARRVVVLDVGCVEALARRLGLAFLRRRRRLLLTGRDAPLGAGGSHAPISMPRLEGGAPISQGGRRARGWTACERAQRSAGGRARGAMAPHGGRAGGTHLLVGCFAFVTRPPSEAGRPRFAPGRLPGSGDASMAPSSATSSSSSASSCALCARASSSARAAPPGLAGRGLCASAPAARAGMSASSSSAWPVGVAGIERAPSFGLRA